MRTLLIVTAIAVLACDAVPQTKVTDSDIKAFVTKLRDWDQNAAKYGDIIVNIGGATTTSSTTDQAPDKFFTYVNEDIFNTPSFAALMNLYSTFHPDCDTAEHFSSDDLAKHDAFLDQVFQSNVMWQTYSFLKSNGVTIVDYATFMEYVKMIWLKQYPRNSNNQAGSSGFEHVFLGEQRSGKVEGLHNWVRFYQLEKANELDYFGHTSDKTGLLAPDVHFKWNGMYKGLSSFIVGSSPEFDLSILTLCFMTNPDSDACQFVLGNYTIKVQAWTENYDGQTEIGTVYWAN